MGAPSQPRGIPRSVVLPEPALNAIITLRNEISPWLMILRVVSDGWQLPDFAPGQIHVERYW